MENSRILMEAIPFDGAGTASISHFESTVAKQNEDYPCPQENRSHGDCDYVIVYNDRLNLLLLAKTLSSSMTLTIGRKKRLRRPSYEPEPSGYTALRIGYAQNGIGSNSFGLVLKDEYRF